MSLVAHCNRCGHQEVVPAVLAGQDVGCRRCRSTLTLPDGVVQRARTVAEVARLVGHRASISGAVFTPDGRFVVSCSQGELDSAQAQPGPVAGSDYSIRVWEVNTRREVRRMTDHTAAVTGVAVSPDGRYILSGSEDRTVRLWDFGSGRELRRYEGHAEAVSCVGFSPRGRYAVSGGYDRTVRVWEVGADRPWDMTRGRQLRCYEIDQLPGRWGGTPHAARFSPDGRQIVAGCADSALRLWDAKTGHLVRLCQGHTERVYGVAYPATGDHILSGSYDGTMRLWDLATGREQLRLWVGRSITDVALSPDARFAFCSSLEGSAEMWSVQEGRLLCRLGPRGSWSVDRSADGRLVLSAGADLTIRLYDISSATD